MIDLTRIESLTPREKTDYLNGVRARLVASIGQDKRRVRELCASVLNDTLGEEDTAAISLSIGDHTIEMKGLAENLLQNQAALRMINSALITVREEHYRESNELL